MTVTDPQQPTDAEPGSRPPSCEELAQEAAERPKSLRLLPRITADALRLVWAASPPLLLASIALKLVNGLGLAAALVFGRDLIESVLAADTSGTPGIGVVAPQLAAVVGILAALGVVTAAGRDVREILSETTARHAKQAIIGVAASVELSAYETPSFHDRLVRASAGEHRPIQMVDGLIGTIGAVASVAGIVIALLAIQPWLVPLLLLLAGLPLLAGVMKAGQAIFGFHMRVTSATRARNYLYGLLTGKDPAKEVRAFGLGDYLGAPHTTLYNWHMAELRKVTASGSGSPSPPPSGWPPPSAPASPGCSPWRCPGGWTSPRPRRRPGPCSSSASGSCPPSTASATCTRPACSSRTSPRSSPPPRSPMAPLEPGRRRTGRRPRRRERLRQDHPGQAAVPALPANGWPNHLGRHRHRRPGPGQLHRRIALIFQDFARYDLTARENSGLGAVERIDDLDAIREAARHAGTDHHLAALPAGYETILSPEYDGGRDLSVGQWQRVALARAFIRDAPLIILDEPTASLDPRAEHDLYTRIRSLYAGRTVLLISHRYNTVRDADHIYVLADGRIIEHGSHDQLIAARGIYAELFTLQAAAYTDHPNGHRRPPSGAPLPAPPSQEVAEQAGS
jgi:ATP-binding cassette, subfamily B, bacterial